MGAFMIGMASIDARQHVPVMVLFAILRIAAGALTMAAGVIAAIQVFRNVRRQAHQFAPRGMATAS